MSVVQLEQHSSGAEFDVDPHGVESNEPEPDAQAEQQQDAVAQVVAMGWTPEEATALVCALWNLGILLYGPEWAADPRETYGWNITVAQMLDLYVPKGTGGMVQLGAGMLMIGNGLVMMAARRMPLIQRGPKPIWVKRPESEGAAATTTQPSPAPASRPASDGHYEIPKDLVPPTRDDSLTGIGI